MNISGRQILIVSGRMLKQCYLHTLWMLTVNVYIIVIHDVITVNYCKCILNNDKTEWLIFNGNPDFSKSVTLTVGAKTIKQSTSIRNLGVRLEPDLTMLPHIHDTCRSGYYNLRRIYKIRKYLSDYGSKH